MDQSFGNITVPQRDTTNTQDRHQEDKFQQRFIFTPTTDLVQVQFLQVHEHYTCANEQQQFEQRVVQEMQECTGCCQRIVMAQQTLHTDSDNDKTDLGHGGACQCSLQVYREYCQYSTHYHCDDTQDQDQVAPLCIMHEQFAAHDDCAEHTCFCQDTGQQCTGRCRCYAVCVRQPDMQREQTCFCSKAEQDQNANSIECCFVFLCVHEFCQFSHIQCTSHLIHHEQTHQCYQTTDDRYCHICICRADCMVIFFMNNQHCGSEGHDFEEDECCEQICRKENAHCRTQCQEYEQIVAISVSVICHIFFGEQCCHQPDSGCQHCQDHTKAICSKADAQTAEIGDLINCFLTDQHQGCAEYNSTQQPCPDITSTFVAFTDHITDHSTKERKEYQKW